MALRNTENEAAGPRVTTAAESHERTNSARANISCTPSETEMLEYLTTYVLIVTSSMGRHKMEYARVHWSTLEYTGVHRSTPEYTGVHWGTLEYNRVH